MSSDPGEPGEPRDPKGSSPTAAPRSLRGRIAGPALATLIFALAAFSTYGEIWQRGASSVVPVSKVDEDRRGFLQTIAIADVTFETWLVARNAQTLATAPHRLFDAEHCAPAEHSLTFGIPMITMGLLAIPTQLLGGEPVLTYNVTLVALSLVGALAMYLLIVAWTGLPAAGIVAGLFFGFQTARMEAIMHPSVWDVTWLVFALFFAERLTARGRWGDAVGLAASVALQIGASFYTLLGAVFAVPPFALWLLLRDRLRAVSIAQLLAVVAVSGAAATLFLGPYLRAETATGGMRRANFIFAPLSSYLPGGTLYPGTCLALLALIALVIPRARLGLRITGDPRWVLIGGALIVTMVAAGSTSREWVAAQGFESLSLLVPDFYSIFASFVPGLEAVRVVQRITQGGYVLITLLAGMGAAFLIRSSGRYAPLAATALVLVAGLDLLRPPALGFERPYEWIYEEIRPSEAELAFFEELERQGNQGPILEVPVSQRVLFTDPPKILLSAYHGRRTSACFGSYFPSGRKELAKLAKRLPQPDAVQALRDLGFTTVVWHHPGRKDPMTRGPRAKRRAERWGTRIHGVEDRSAYPLELQGDAGVRIPSGPDTLQPPGPRSAKESQEAR